MLRVGECPPPLEAFVLVKRFLMALALFLAGCTAAFAADSGPWTFAVSGDSRDCGDVVMPCIAAGARAHGASFYWHLGDFRHISDFDPDMLHNPDHRGLTIEGYLSAAWDDFIARQVAPFGDLPVFLGIGNHELTNGRTRAEFIPQFADWLNAPVLRAQRLQDDPADHRLKTYFHWIQRGVDFINMDNASPEQFDRAQVAWLERILAKDTADPSITTVVVGMHEALPESLSRAHSMNQSPAGEASGHKVYADLVALRPRKKVYVLTSHSHFYMANIYNTVYWRAHGGVLPGWIAGTAGAQRRPLPEPAAQADEALEHTYGYLLATVQPNGEIRFAFQKIEEKDVPADVTQRFGADFVHWAFQENFGRAKRY